MRVSKGEERLRARRWPEHIIDHGQSVSLCVAGRAWVVSQWGVDLISTLER